MPALIKPYPVMTKTDCPDQRRRILLLGALATGLGLHGATACAADASNAADPAVTASGASAGAGAGAALTSRIVSIGGALTEIVYALGAEQSLVGVDTTSLYPQAASKLPSVGYARSLSSEGILALAPNHVLATEDAGPHSVLKQIEAAGIRLTVLPARHQFEGVLERIQRIGQIVGRQSTAEKLILTLKQQWQASLQTVASSSKKSNPAVLFVLSHTPNQVMVGGQGSSAEAMLEYAGAHNAVNGFRGFKALTPEAVIAAQPEIVLLTSQGLEAIGGIDGAMRLPGIAQTPAGRKRKIIALEAMYMLGFGPRLPAAVSELHQLIRTVGAV